MVSKTRMLDWVKGFEWREVARGLDESPELMAYRDERGRNWLHVCCGVNAKKTKQSVADSIKTAEVLLDAGYDVNEAAFTEGDWFHATPLWYSISRGENLELAKFLLKKGSNPNNALWAAAFNHDLDAIRLLVKSGADIDQDGPETPFLGAVKWSLFDSAEALLKLGANPNWQDKTKMTALHYMLKKGSDKTHIEMVIRYGARVDIPNKDGVTAAEIMSRKKDPDYKRMLARAAAGKRK